MLTREEFQTIYDQGPDAVFALVSSFEEQLALLALRLKELEDRLGKDSHNSNKPPSSDGLRKKPAPQSLRQKTGRNPGGQKGHPGHHLAFAATPDQIIEHAPTQCACCGLDLETICGQEGERRQVLDLPPLSLQVTEHRSLCKVCPACGHSNAAPFPEEVAQPVQYGPRVKALSIYLSSYQLLPYGRIAGLFADLFGAPLSPGTLFAAQQDASSRLEEGIACIKKGLLGAEVVDFDETGLRILGRLHWLHSASTPTLTYYDWDQKRGKAGMDKVGILPKFLGIAVHDGWDSYRHYACSHALCNAHHLRELTALYEEGGQEWAKSLRALFVQIKQAVEKAKEQNRPRLHPGLEARFEAQYHKLLQEGLAANPPPEPIPGKRGRPKQSAARNLLDRLQRDAGATLRFMYDFRVPFDNNLAERDIRMMKVQQKVSGCFRSTEGADAFCRLRCYISTLQKQGHQILAALERVFLGTPIMPQCTAE
jgi:transposase